MSANALECQNNSLNFDFYKVHDEKGMRQNYALRDFTKQAKLHNTKASKGENSPQRRRVSSPRESTLAVHVDFFKTLYFIDTRKSLKALYSICISAS